MSNEINEIKAYYDELIDIEQREVIRLNEELTIRNEKLSDLIRTKRSKIKKVLLDLKDNERYVKYRNIEINKNDVFFVDIEPNRCYFRIGKYNFYSNKNVINIRIEVIKESIKQYKLAINFSHEVGITQYGYTSNTLSMSIKKLNFNDFLNKNSKSFRREVTMSNLLE